jgi:hypothetical protein
VGDGSGGEHDGALGEEHIATYREIAAHWGLAGVDVARVKAKRARWRQLPRNHPADPVRVAIPRAAWDIAVMNGGGASGLQGEVTTPSSKSDARPPSGKFSSRDKEVARALAILHELREQVRVAQERAARAEAAAAAERVRAQEATTEAAAVRAEAETLRVVLIEAEAAATVARAEAATATAEAESIRMEQDRITTERDRLRIELEAWTAGGRLARAWRAFLNRR